MQNLLLCWLVLVVLSTTSLMAQQTEQRPDSTSQTEDSISLARRDSLAQVRIQDSIRRKNQAIADSIQRQAEILQAQADSIKRANQLYIDSLRANQYPVILKDTLLYIYSGIGELTIQARARRIENRLRELVNRLDFQADSLYIQQEENYWNVFHKDEIVLTVTPEDSAARGLGKKIMAENYLDILKTNLIKQREYKSLLERAKEIGLTLVALLIIYLLYRITNRVFRYFIKRVYEHRAKWFKGFTYNKYEVLTPERQLSFIVFGIKSLRLFTHLLMLYLTLPIIFSIFPATRGIADLLLGYILNPLQRIGLNILQYIPNLFAILIIYICTRYFVRFLKFITQEISSGKLVIQGFYAD